MALALLILLVVLGAILLAVLVCGAIALFSPIVCAVDTAAGQMRAHWLLLEYTGPIPGADGERGLFLAGRRVRLGRGKRARKLRPERKQPKKSRASFFLRCLGDSTIRRAVGPPFVNLVRRILRSASIAEWCVRVSLPDPAANGMLYGGLAAFGWAGRTDLQVNFSGENSLFLEIRIHPFRIVVAVLRFLAGFPFRAAYRHWRAAAESG